jgi:hypothetical protein
VSDDVVIPLLAVLVGATATGAVDTFTGWRLRKVERTVAARLILGDLLEAAVDVVLDRRQWPDRYDFSAPVETWRETRDRFAARPVKAWEWTVVDGAYSNLARTAP